MHQSTWFNDPDLALQEPEAALAYLHSVAATYTLRVQQTLNELQTMPGTWRDSLDMNDWALRLTPEETAALHQDLRDVVARCRPDTPEAAASAPKGAERVGVITHVLPELDVPATSAAPSGPRKATGTETS